MIFLHGNKCSPEELLGLGKSKYADSVALDLAKAGIRVLFPIKYDMNQFNYSEEITISAAVHGSTFEALEQMKIKAFITYIPHLKNQLYMDFLMVLGKHF